MAYCLECAGPLSSKDVSEADIQRAFDDDAGRGEFAILHAPDGSFLQTAGEGEGPYVLEHRDGATEEHVQAAQPLTKAQVRDAFLQYLHGDDAWRTSREWQPLKLGPLKESGGCFSVVLVTLAIGCAAVLIG